MTELEMMQRAQMYLNQLANGEDPITGQILPEEDVVNNVRISRCLFYVSSVLQQVIENGGRITSGKGGKPFFISDEDALAFAYSETPVTVSEITKRLNALIPSPEISNLKLGSITAFLVSCGLLEKKVLMNGRTVRVPTDQGKQMGIITEERYGANGAYLTVLYERQAQQFIIDNIEGIIQTNRESCGRKRQG